MIIIVIELMFLGVNVFGPSQSPFNPHLRLVLNTLHYITLRYATLHMYVTLRYVTLRYVMLCFILLHCDH